MAQATHPITHRVLAPTRRQLLGVLA
ncbi:MAG: hypothetical protein Q605_AUC00690G0001, partial [Actinomyces urogenitalis DORA_12]